jgi:hypothetical protein
LTFLIVGIFGWASMVLFGDSRMEWVIFMGVFGRTQIWFGLVV